MKSAESNLLGLAIQELTAVVEKFGQPAYRARQLYEAIYRRRVASLDQITTLPGTFRRDLAGAGYAISYPAVQKSFTSVDGTIRYLMSFTDGQSVEAVWMPEGDDGELGNDEGEHAGDQDGEAAEAAWERATICVSSQVGCAVNCQFCLTALLGVQRNLTAGEIVGQIFLVLTVHGVDVKRERLNLVFMGQGEPFLNYDHFMKAVQLLVEGVGIPETRMTVSTAGIVPRIHDFAREPIRPKLAISLNASHDE